MKHDTLLLAGRRERKKSSSGSRHSPAQGLPPDLLRDASRRISWVGLIYAAVYAVAFFPSFAVVLAEGIIDRGESIFQTTVALASIALGIAVFLFARNTRRSPEFIIKVGLIFEVLGSLGISMSYWDMFRNVPEGKDVSILISGVSWVCNWIVIFPLVAPSRPRSTFVASFASALTSPVVFAISTHYHPIPPSLLAVFDPWALYFLMFLPNLICVGIAVVGSMIVYRLGRALSEARELGSYKLVERLGMGGMGEVWRAEHKMLARPAAVKLIRPDAGDLGDEQSVLTLLQRFDREAQATALLTSPHTVQIYDFGVGEDHTFYYVMELLRGVDLETLVNRFGPMSPERVIHLLLQACHSLREAHHQGLVHRDIKPANLVACHFGDECDFLKVLDFGLVKVESDGESTDLSLTQQGTAAGTPATMAPEVARGRPADERADIYGLGCTAYWLLTGQPVFDGETSMEVIIHHIQSPPVPPSQRGELPVPADLERIVLDCLAKDPADRPDSIVALRDRLEACADAGGWIADRAEQWWRANLPDMMAGSPTMRKPQESH